jgi:hypothetical protein
LSLKIKAHRNIPKIDISSNLLSDSNCAKIDQPTQSSLSSFNPEHDENKGTEAGDIKRRDAGTKEATNAEYYG